MKMSYKDTSGIQAGRLMSLVMFTVLSLMPFNAQANNALEFDGNNQLAIINFNGSGLTTTLTVECWIAPASLGANEVILTLTDGWAEWHLAKTSSNLLELRFNASPYSDYTATPTTATISTDWSHLAMIFTGTDWDLFLNGTQILEEGIANTFNPANMTALQISGDNFAGKVDDLRLWSDVRTPTEIRQNMMKSLVGNEAGLLAEYEFDQATGTTLTDSGGNYNGTLHYMGDSDWVTSLAYTTWLGTTSTNFYVALNWSNGIPIYNNSSYCQNYGVFDAANDPVNIREGGSNIYIGAGVTTVLTYQISVGGNLILDDNLDLNTASVLLGSTGQLIEDGGRLICSSNSGYIRADRDLNNVSAENLGGLGAAFTSAANMGTVTVERYNASASGSGMLRYYKIWATTLSGLDATLIFHYDENELNGFSESTLKLYSSSDNGSTWTQHTASTVDVDANTITLTGIDAFSPSAGNHTRWEARGAQPLFSGGSGTTADPYQIANTADLIYLSQNSGTWASHFKQTADISFNADQTTVDWDGDGSLEHGADGDDAKGFSAIGHTYGSISDPTYYDYAFTGSYDGQNYSITNLFADRAALSNDDKWFGLFGLVVGDEDVNSIELQNIKLVDLDINADFYNRAPISGGLAAQVSGAVVQYCSSSGSLTTNNNMEAAGGIVGISSNSTLAYCFSSCSVDAGSSSGNYVGGLVGSSTGAISKSYSTGQVSGGKYAGGLVGDCIGNQFTSYISTITDCYSLGAVSSTSTASGGLAGRIQTAHVTRTYAAGAVSGSGATGGLAGVSGGSTVTASFWDTQTSGLANSAAGTGKTTAEMQTQSTYTSASWSLSGTQDPNYTWSLVSGTNSGYPYLSWASSYDSSLPVELSSWKAESRFGQVELSWVTDSETENLGFVVERRGADEARTWTEIASFTTHQELAGQGSTTRAHSYSYTDKDVKTGKHYEYRLSDVAYDGKRTTHASLSVMVVFADTDTRPGTLTLLPAFPNPFNPETTISYALTEGAELSLSIYDLRGREVWRHVAGEQAAGLYQLSWNGRDSNDNTLDAGVYLLAVQAGSDSRMLKLMLIK